MSRLLPPEELRYLYHVNLLPYNVGRGVSDPFSRTGSVVLEEFQDVLKKNNITSSFRNSFGHNIDAACGQLFAGYEARIQGPAGPRSEAEPVVVGT